MIAVSWQHHLNHNCYGTLRQPNGAWFCTLLREEWAVAGMDVVIHSQGQELRAQFRYLLVALRVDLNTLWHFIDR